MPLDGPVDLRLLVSQTQKDGGCEIPLPGALEETGPGTEERVVQGPGEGQGCVFNGQSVSWEDGKF